VQALLTAKVGAADVAPADTIVTPEPAAKVKSPAPELIKVIALPTPADVSVESGAIVTIFVLAFEVITAT
jgi:hypothetical protein